MSTESEKLRETMRQWTTGVCVVCSRIGVSVYGMTVNSFTSVSLDPPIISVTLASGTRTSSIVQESGFFSVSILSSDQKEIADRFSGKANDKSNRFAGIETITLPGGQVALKDALAVLECRVIDRVKLRNSTVFLAEVDYTNVGGKGNPLVYHNREYGSYEKSDDR